MMFSLPFGAPPGQPLRLLALGAHADDLEIGCGGTILRTLREVPSVSVCWAVASAPDPARHAEAIASAEEMLAGAEHVEVVIGDFRDGHLPYAGGAVKEWVHALASFEADVVLTHQRNDLHQDHRLLAELALNAFRDHLILGFEIPKYDGDLGAPNVFVHVDRATCDQKLDHVRRHFGTQQGKPWFDEETFRGLMRLRGVESRAGDGYAEAFYCTKLVLAPGAR